jgi:2,3-bisphosphoglycerate-independent phosphoglycerate mutase
MVSTTERASGARSGAQEDRPKPVVLCILDGWGVSAEGADNAIAQAKTPVWASLLETCPTALIETSGVAVGLPAGQMGNSEVGHMNIGGGRVVLQDLPRIDHAIETGEIAKIPALVDLIAALKSSGGTCHLVGLMSPGGVHSHQDHIAALARIIAGAGIPVAVHALLDGRDTPPRSATGYIRKFEAAMADMDNVSIATVIGRYFAMDRDKRWDRVEKAYVCMVEGEGHHAPTAEAAVAAGYERGQNDEFVEPTVIGDFKGMRDGDGLLMANFRADRARQVLMALVENHFEGFPRHRRVDFAAKCGMVEYSDVLNRYLPALFPAERVVNTLGEVMAKAGLKQLRIAETEKYAHVTFFLNGGDEHKFSGEDRILVPSPKVATYDLQPEMSAPEVTERLVQAIESGIYDLIVVNFANPDMVGHTGILSAAVKAVETVDQSLGELRDALTRVGGAMLITADHGNLEQMSDPVTHQPHTAHTTNLVPLVLVDCRATHDMVSLANGRLADIAPTVLELMELPKPKEMTGHSLINAMRQGAANDRRVLEASGYHVAS